MSDEYGSEVEVSEERFSSFWPLFILILGLFLWTGFQAYSTYRQCSGFNAELDGAGPTVKAAEDAQNKLYALAQDLLQVGTKDTYAAQIVKEANIQVHAPPSTNAPDANAMAPSSAASTNTPASAP
jgi:hypothetical protein